jgi:hypothetical protein
VAGIGDWLTSRRYWSIYTPWLYYYTSCEYPSTRVLAPIYDYLYMGNAIVSGGVYFIRHVIGIFSRPYETYRRIVKEGSLWELVYIAALLSLYFIVASIVKTSLFRPYLLTRQFIVLMSATALTFIFVVSLFLVFGRLVGGNGTWRELALGWGYSLIPTVMWFWMTSLLFVLIPPPRTTSALGITFSVVYLLVSACLFFWKIILSYLALRFGLRLDLKKILILSMIVLPVLGIFSVGMYKAGIFRVPFI